MPYSEELRSEPMPYRKWGEAYIDPEATRQMDSAMRLPISVAGALMPDAHVGYGLPIGGILATEERGHPLRSRGRYCLPNAAFGLRGFANPHPAESWAVQKSLDGANPFWCGRKMESKPAGETRSARRSRVGRATKLLKSLKDTAYDQLGTSGTGNHFVEWGSLTLETDDKELELKAGNYLALLSHSGSRGGWLQNRQSLFAGCHEVSPQSGQKRSPSRMAAAGLARGTGILAFDGTRRTICCRQSLRYSPAGG